MILLNVSYRRQRYSFLKEYASFYPFSAYSDLKKAYLCIYIPFFGSFYSFSLFFYTLSKSSLAFYEFSPPSVECSISVEAISPLPKQILYDLL